MKGMIGMDIEKFESALRHKLMRADEIYGFWVSIP
jgi:hypothetical protein